MDRKGWSNESRTKNEEPRTKGQRTTDKAESLMDRKSADYGHARGHSMNSRRCNLQIISRKTPPTPEAGGVDRGKGFRGPRP